MPYQQLIPRPTDQLNVSQGDIQQNFLEIYNWVAVNHEQFDTANAGKHKQVTLPENVAPTLTNADEANIYSQLSTRTGVTELFWQRENAGANAREIIEWTGLSATANGWTRLPSGILLKWGLKTAGINNPVPVVFPVAATIPAFNPLVATNPFTVFLVPLTNTSSITTVAPASITNLGFSANTFLSNTGAFTPVGFYYLAIGI